MLMDLVLLGLLLSRNHFLKIPVFRKPHLIISMLLIIGSPIWFRPVKLSWFDTPMNYSYRLEVTTATGKSYIIPSDFLAPFNFQFSTSVLNYLSKKPLLPISWGATYDVKTAAWLNDPHIPEQIFNRELNFGRIYYNPEKAALFDSFLHQSLIHWNERLTKDLWLTKLQPPTFHWTFARSPVFATTEPIIRVVVIQVTSYFGNGYYEEIRTTPVYQTAIP
jgi:hypothetical protein